MTYRGLFVGIDRYLDQEVNWLSGAARDARVMNALFADNLGDTAELLTDEAATATAIIEALALLSAVSTEHDVLYLFFAGHGTDDHRLVPYDAQVNDLAGTCISLDALAEELSTIAASHLVCVLDCCFSGGFGARVLASGVRARGPLGESVEAKLARFTGTGRVVLTASAANEEAFESNRHGHGLLTFRLLEALQGVDEVREADQVSWLRLVEYVTRHVQADARQMGSEQTPTFRGQIDGFPSWPVLEPGDRYRALVPAVTRPAITDDLAVLVEYGISKEVVDSWTAAIPALNRLQQDAINNYAILDGESLVVSAPTSSGKTMIGELAALSGVSQRRRTIFLLPMRALVNDKYEHLIRQYEPLGVKTVRATGEHSDDVPALLGGRFDIALLTYEKYSHLALGNPHLLDLAATVVVDEAQILTDVGRGSNLEFVLTLLNNRRGATGSPQIITLSAVVGDLRGLDHWLGARHLHSDERPVPLVEGVIGYDGSYRHLDIDGQEQRAEAFVNPLPDSRSRSLVIPLVARLVAEGKKVIVFRQTRGEALQCAGYLADALRLDSATSAIDALPSADPSTSAGPLRDVLQYGVAFHSSDLGREERHVVETEFRDPDSALRVVTATPTLAMGVNTPANAVVVVGLTHPSRPPTPYTVAEYKNMVGRAGRLGIAERGESYLIPEGQLDAVGAWDAYVTGSLETLESQLVPDGDPRSLMLRVLATYPADVVGAVSADDVIGFLESSFAAHQARAGGSSQWTPDALQQSFRQLEGANLITPVADRYQLTGLGRFTGESGVHVDSILRLVHVLRGAGELSSSSLVTAAQLTLELDDVYLPVNAKGRRTELPRWPNLLANQGVPLSLIGALERTAQDQRQAVSRHKKAATAVMWMGGVPTGDIELSLTQHMRQRGGVAGAVRACADRTRDLLPAIGAVAQQLGIEVVDGLLDRTALRLELGIRAEVAQLALDLDVNLDRAVWNRLAEAGLTTPSDILAAEDRHELEDLLGSARARVVAAAGAVSLDVLSVPAMPPVVE